MTCSHAISPVVPTMPTAAVHIQNKAETAESAENKTIGRLGFYGHNLQNNRSTRPRSNNYIGRRRLVWHTGGSRARAPVGGATSRPIVLRVVPEKAESTDCFVLRGYRPAHLDPVQKSAHQPRVCLAAVRTRGNGSLPGFFTVREASPFVFDP